MTGNAHKKWACSPCRQWFSTINRSEETKMELTNRDSSGVKTDMMMVMLIKQTKSWSEHASRLQQMHVLSRKNVIFNQCLCLGSSARCIHNCYGMLIGGHMRFDDDLEWMLEIGIQMLLFLLLQRKIVGFAGSIFILVDSSQYFRC